MQELDDYKLEGYDCTLGSHPSPLIPIISRNSEYQAVYFDDNFQIQLRRIDVIDSDTTAKFSYLSNCHEDIKNKLEKFDYRKHKLFAKDENNVEFYEVEDETYFFVKLLIDKSFSKDNPFVRVSYAKATGIKDLIDREKENYEQYLKTKSKDREKKFWEKYKNFTVEDTTSSLFNAIPVTGEKASEVGADYTRLRKLLQNNDFEEADKETEFWLRMLEKLGINPTKKVKDWHTIDKLWVIGSGGKIDFTPNIIKAIINIDDTIDETDIVINTVNYEVMDCVDETDDVDESYAIEDLDIDTIEDLDINAIEVLYIDAMGDLDFLDAIEDLYIDAIEDLDFLDDILDLESEKVTDEMMRQGYLRKN
jgi:hypothetical protein